VEYTSRELLIYSIPQSPLTLKSHLPSNRQHVIPSGSRISYASPLLFLDTEFAKDADQHIVTGCEGRFDQLKQNLDCFDKFLRLNPLALAMVSTILRFVKFMSRDLPGRMRRLS